jgi:hypothetical protein
MSGESTARGLNHNPNIYGKRLILRCWFRGDLLRLKWRGLLSLEWLFVGDRFIYSRVLGKIGFTKGITANKENYYAN